DSNDAQETPDGTYYGSGNNCDEGTGTATFGSCGTDDASSYYRFVSKGITNGATITSATLTLYAVLNGYNDDSGISTRFQGITEDNTPIFSSGNKPSTRSRTTAFVDKSDWVSVFTSQYNPITIDVTNIVQEIVDQPGFKVGNTIGITQRRNGGNAGAYGSVWEYTGSPTYAPKLDIEFSFPASDSTSYGINGSLTGGVTQGSIGQTGYGYAFNGVDGVVNFGNPADGHFDFGLESFSFSLWLKDSPNGLYQRPVWKGASSTGTPGYSMYRRDDGDTVIAVGDNIDRKRQTTSSFPYDTMTYVTGVVDRENNLLFFYMNGIPIGSATDISTLGNSTSPSYDLQLSRITNPVNGTIDEFRLSNVSRSADWITTEFNNQIDPSSFYVISSEKVQSEWPYPDFQYRKKITVDNTKVSGTSTLEDFPMLIDLYDYDLRTLVQPDGDDIAFTDVTGTLLDYEIELFNQTYNNTHAHLVAWVRVPSLSATINTNITMYYGNSTLSSQENVEGVWDANFKVVHHLEEDPTGTIYDSTSNNNDATSYGTMTSNDQVSGKINGALDFDGSDDYISWTTAISSTSGTYSWWMYTHSVVGERNYIADDAYRRRISLWDDVVKIETDTEAEYFDFTTSSISANTWAHIVFVRSGDVGDLYVDGLWVQQVNVPGADNLTLSGIGGTSDNIRMVDGLMDEVRISNITRSFDWIATE
ncbi:MAG: DUF2341 domain-containing protein, partial [Candidatus Kariarchaeaceae archaeon]